MRLLLIRHGETLFNQLDYTQGWVDSQLTEKGIRQAQYACKQIKNIHIDQAFSSYSERAYDTACLALKDRSIKVIRDKRLKEFHYGSFEGNPNNLLHSIHKTLPETYYNYRMFGGENTEDVIEREMNLIEELSLKYPNQTILLAGHGMSLKVLYEHIAYQSLMEKAPEYSFIGNGDVMLIEYNGRDSKIIEIYRNEV